MRVDAQCTATSAACPGCGIWSSRVHGSYLRFPADVPSAGRSVVLRLRVRRFTCRNAECERRTFVEQIPVLTYRHSHRQSGCVLLWPRTARAGPASCASSRRPRWSPHGGPGFLWNWRASLHTGYSGSRGHDGDQLPPRPDRP
ncbi:transposase family protein [Streptomyces sp. INA 01156]